MVLVAIFLVFVPIIGEPVDAAIAVGLILPAIPVYFIFVYKYKHRPKIFTRINGMFNMRICTIVHTYIRTYMCTYTYVHTHT